MSVYDKTSELQHNSAERISLTCSCNMAPRSISRESANVHRCCRRISSALTGAAFSSHSRLLWLFVLAIGFLNQAAFSAAQDEAVTVYYNSEAGPPPLNPRECFAMFDTLDQVTYICRDHPDMVPLLQYADRLAKDECEKQFEKELWNCSDFSLLKTPKINEGSKVYREGAYVDALSIAAIAHTIAKACSEGLLKSCTCDDEEVSLPSGSNSVEYEQGCSDNIDYGLDVAKRFLNKRFTSVGRDLKHELVQHNFRAAEEAIKGIIAETPVTCTCVGVSGSCTVQVCHSVLPEFEVLGEKLRETFDDACKVSANGHSDNAWISECSREYTTKDLIYRNTYDWCVADDSVGAPGVVGRRCDPNTTGAGSCESLCRTCNRRPQQHQEQYQYQCHCSFHFCCEIRCSVCEGERTYYTCE